MAADITYLRRTGDGLLTTTNIAELLPDWKRAAECWMFVSPHDDDVAIGAGLTFQAGLAEGAAVHAVVVTDGRMGYCDFQQRRDIVKVRRAEAEKSYRILGSAGRPPAIHRVPRLQPERLPRPPLHHDRRADGNRRGRRNAERLHARAAADPAEPRVSAHQRRPAPRPSDRPRGGAHQPVPRPGQHLARVGRADRRSAPGVRVCLLLRFPQAAADPHRGQCKDA